MKKYIITSNTAAGITTEHAYEGTPEGARLSGMKYGCTLIAVREATAKEWQHEMWRAEDADYRIRGEEGDR